MYYITCSYRSSDCTLHSRTFKQAEAVTEREGWRRQSTKQYPDSSSSPCVRQSREPMTVLDSPFHTVDWGFQVPDSSFWSVELRFRIPVISGIPDSLSKISDSKAQDSGFHKQNFSEVWIPQAKFSRSLEFPGFGESGLHNNLDYIG